ncbi:MAG: hypothetical protein ACLGP3_10425 [Acidobacteriota bacterium]
MNAQDWQAAAEILGVVLVLGNVIFSAAMYRMAAKFVTRSEHSTEHAQMRERLEKVEEEVEDIAKGMGQLVTTDQAAEIYRRLGGVEQQTAKMVGQLGGIETQLNGVSHMLQMLVQNEIEGSRK